jgi:hypothetical protein
MMMALKTMIAYLYNEESALLALVMRYGLLGAQKEPQVEE